MSPLRQPAQQGLLKTGQTTAYAANDDGDLVKGITKAYTVLSSGNQTGTKAVYLPCFAQDDLVFGAAGAATITSVKGGLAVVKNNDVIRIRGSTSNDAEFTVTAAGGNNANTITLTTVPTSEVSAVYVTIAKQALQSNNCVVDLNTGLMWMRYGSYSPAKLGATSTGALYWTATAVIVHAAAVGKQIQMIAGGKGLCTVKVIASAGEVLVYWPGYSYSFGFAGAVNKLPGFRCVSVTVNGLDLDLVMATGNQTCTAEAAMTGAINLSCNGIFDFANACIAAGVGGYSDWKVANIQELVSLPNINNTGAVPNAVFASWPTAALWSSSTTFPADAGNSWYVLFANTASLTMGARDAQTAAVFAILVRGGV